MAMIHKRYTDEIVKADNLWRLQKRLRKGSWVARCVEWDSVYREMMLRRVDPLSEKRHIDGGIIRVKYILDREWIKQFEEIR